MRRRWFWIGGGALLVVLIAAIAYFGGGVDRLREHRLYQAASALRFRITAARLAELRHAPVRNADQTGMVFALRAATDDVLMRSTEPGLRGRAMLLRGNASAAVDELRRAAEKGDARSLTDLSAALIAQSDALEDPELALDAIVAARRAVAADPTSGAAQFNLALALERIGLMNEARGVYETAARLDSGTGWASEASSRAAAAKTAQTRPWSETEKLLASSNDPDEWTTLVLADVAGARRCAEGSYLTSWAEKTIAGDSAAARENLERARRIANVLQASVGERFAFDAVAAIDRAEARGSTAALAMAKAHVLYLDGRIARGQRLDSVAINRLTEAAAALAREGSPLQYAAVYFKAGGFYEQGRIAETLKTLETLDPPALRAQGYLGLTAQLEWERGICLISRGSHAEAFDGFERSRRISEAIGDRELAMRFEGLAAEALDNLGDSRGAWRMRARALRAYSLAFVNDSRIPVTLTSSATVQIVAQHWERACVLLDFGAPLAAAAKDAPVATYAFAARSVCRDELGDFVAASADRAEAARWLAKVDAGSHERLSVELEIADGVAERMRSPREAVQRYTRAIDTLQSGGQTLAVPRLLFERARAYETAGEIARARADLHAALSMIDEWERSAANADQRATLGIWSDAIRRDLIALDLAARDVTAAFATADDHYSAVSFREPADARSSLALPAVRSALANDAAIVEFANTRIGLVAFIVRSQATHAVRLSFDFAHVAAAEDAIRDGEAADFGPAATTLHEAIFTPIAKNLAGVRTLAIIPTPELAGIPFGALHDAQRDRDLIDDFIIVHAPTAAAAIHRSRQTLEPRGSGVLAIGASRFDRARYPGVTPLNAVEREVRAVARATNGELLAGENATPQNVSRMLPSVGVIHYAGHIVGRGGDARFLLAPSQNRDTLASREIAELGLPMANVVVLAGCRGTGSTVPHAVVGDMASGFLAAGVPTVIASASDIDDGAATPVVLRIHELLHDGRDAADAVRQVTVSMQRDDPARLLALRLVVLGGSRWVISVPPSR